MERECLGSALVDYMLPTALVGLVVGLGVYGLYESGTLSKFLAASGNMTVENGVAKIGDVDNTGSALVNSGDNDSTPANETDDTSDDTGGDDNSDVTVTCTAGNCDIDLGGYVLTGVPEDFGEYIESSGNSGGTEILAAILDRLAEDPSLTSDQRTDIKGLANMGHQIASYQTEIEGMAGDISSSDYSAWYRDAWRNVENISFDQSLSSVLSEISGANSNIKNIVEILGNEILDINNDFVDQCSVIQQNVDTLNSGSGIGNTVEELTYTILNPKASERTDVDSAIICKTGDGSDTGTQCN